MSNEVKRQECELDWNSRIENDSPDYILLPDGDYEFLVVDYERARHPGSEKLPPCAKAIVHLRIETPQGVSTIKHNLFLHTRTEGMLCAFFAAIGQRKKGEAVQMNWNVVPGSRGRAKIGIRTYKGDDGQERQFNEVKKFYEWEASGNYEAGKF